MWERWVRRGLLGLSAALASFLIYLLATRVESVPPPTSASQGPLSQSDAGIDQFKYIQSRAGTVQWEVLAQRAHMFETEKRAVLDRVQVTLYGAKGREMRLEGDEGTIDIARKDFVLANRSAPINVRLESGYTISTNHIAWTDEKREISTSDPVTIFGHGLEIKGQGLVGKLDREEFRILDNVRAEISQ
ncbi:MAG: LPS export ABC transporter periplasmic protein LptC [Nitrospirota bacterium]